MAGPSGEYSTYLTDEQRRDATQMRDFTTGVKPFGALGLPPVIDMFVVRLNGATRLTLDRGKRPRLEPIS